MTNERIQHLKDVIFTADTLGSKDKTVKITHEEAKELFALQSENERLKAERDVLPKLEKGDRIKLYGKETEVIGFEAAWNDGLNPPGYEIILLTIRRGDPFKRSLNCIEVLPPPKQ